MLSFFNSNNAAVVIFYFIYLILFRACFAFTTVDSGFVFEHHEPLSYLLFSFLKIFGLKFEATSIILSALLCFVQAVLINGIVNENKIIAKKNYLPGVLFILFSSLFKESLLLTPATVAFTFLILCVSKIFSLIKREKPSGDIFDAGFLVAIASLFYFPSVLFILFVLIAVVIVRPFAVRETIIVLLGFFSAFIILFTFYFWNDKTGFILQDIANITPNGWMYGIAMHNVDRILLGSVSFITVALLILLPSSLHSTLIQVRKFSSVLILFIFFIVVSFFLQQKISLSHLILLGLPLGIISSMAAMQISRKLVLEIVHLILILLVLAGQYLPIFKII